MKTKGIVTGIVSNLVTVLVDGPVAENELCYISMGDTRLMAEVIKVNGKNAQIQVFESTRGLKNGDSVEFEGKMLEITLGPGLLSSVYDGLQNDLTTMEGVFLKRGEYTDPLDREKLWAFTPIAKPGDKVAAADWLGEVKEGWLPHKIMVPFSFKGEFTVKSIVPAGEYNVDHVIAVLTAADGEDVDVTMTQKWPVKVAVRAYREKPRPDKIMETGVRVIDSFNPIAEGGTGFIPGPFGCGKTVLQHAIAKQGEADVIVMAACGERANEVVEIFTEFPELIDPHTGRHLMERTTIICNTSNMPVAAREASVYTAMTICEYYRAMGLRCLLLADSTSRWAQALREMSNRMEELPGADAFPVDLSAIISNFYSRAGMVILNNGQRGAVTFIGTVSPAGGNLKEPVTESTKKAARCFYALEQNRADQKRYPAVNPIDSYSKYLEYPEIREYLDATVEKGWVEKIGKAKNLVLRGREANDQINILGDDGVPMSYHETFWKSELIDFCFLQQDGFDPIDSLCPIERQKYMLDLLLDICDKEFTFDDYEQCRNYFKNVINVIKQMNYSEFHSEDFEKYNVELKKLIEENGK
ncbi:MAG: V-type ATP synthase subunit A [Bacteroidales bacterium]|nr:V-type ATP synthase subunit A [Bacteroidales bacterium]MEE3462821.1 V-type ATP synthase subunit A [Candidatus Cryptobacteroides sp.]SKC41395.1 V/A-type H+-transporting ATPase subunit A [Bacteroidales bacterium WCE2008]MBQ1857672.1 V-type ATP synthase subunit A [Bacteroidales bacterium]MBQ2526359.1 V-type ATP synthase subunit A [Bacteroidales bacterium]